MARIPLKNIPLFHSLPTDELSNIEALLKEVDYSSDTIIFEEGDRGDAFYVIVDGELEIIKARGTREEKVLHVHGPGDFVGEMSLVTRDGRRTASVRACGDVKLLQLHQDDFDKMVQSRPLLAYEMIRELGERLADSDDSSIADLKHKNDELTKAYEELKAAQAELVKKEKMEHELQMARNIQTSILPYAIEYPEGCQIGAKMVPARAVGGDFYDVIPLDEHRVGLSVGDVSDKGVPAAMFMAQICTLLRVQARNELSPKDVLLSINNTLLEMNRNGLFVTMIYGVYDVRTQEFNYARGGHEVPILFDGEGSGEEMTHEQGAALCLFPNPPIDTQVVKIPSDHTLMMYTDGGTDARSETKGFFGLENLRNTFANNIGCTSQEIVDTVIGELQSFQEEDAQFDDITIMAVRSL